jgi:PilZ domain
MSPRWLACMVSISRPLDVESQQRGHPAIPFGLHRASRYPFAASIELTDVRSERLLSARTTNLSLFGCYVYTSSPFPEGTKVSLRILHGGASFAAFGKVVQSKPNSGMGIAFTEIGEPSQAILEKWLATLRTE